MKRDTIIIGAGLAGMYCALELAQHTDVTLVTQGTLTQSNSVMAQGGIAAVLDPLDTPQRHIEDTMIAGAHMNDRAAVEVLVHEGPSHIQKLIELGVEFDRDGQKLSLTREGGHNARRIVHVKDTTGHAIISALKKQILAHPRITVHVQHEVTALVTNTEHTRVVGVRVRNGKKEQVLTAQAVVLATGGSGQLYAHTTNPVGAHGSGVALAHAVGATTQEMEFIQFHPTAFKSDDTPHFLLSEALRGEGAVLKNAKGERFMQTLDERADLAPRDIVSRAMYEQQRLGDVTLEMHQSPEALAKRFPAIAAHLQEHHRTLGRDPIPVTPAAHYQCGGVATDLHAQSSVPGLYAIGEVARTGVHGANRLASNSLLECLVFGARAAQHIATQPLYEITIPLVDEADVIPDQPQDDELQRDIQKTMWQHVGMIRTQEGLSQAREIVHTILKKPEKSLTTSQMAQAALLIIDAALARSESIGAHYLQK